MESRQVAAIFREIAILLELSSEGDDGRAAAYRRAAAELSRSPLRLDESVSLDALQRVPGVGPALARQIAAIVRTGESALLARLRRETPQALLHLLAIPGVGPRTARRLYYEFGVTDLDTLASLLREGEAGPLRRLGRRRIEALREGLARLGDLRARLPLPLADAAIERLRALLREEGAREVLPAGEVRRRCDQVARLDLVVVAERDLRLPHLSLPVPLRVHRARPGRVAGPLLTATGPPAHVEGLRRRAAERGIDWERLLGQAVDEGAIYKALGLPYFPPEIRDHPAADPIGDGVLARKPLLTVDRLCGELHLHTTWSDGTASLAEMAAAARARGYAYMAVTDHSPSLRIANGLSVERFRAQRREIERLNRASANFLILQGAEVDILRDGRLDLPEECLGELDFVVASLHTHFDLDRETQTERLLRAVRHPLVTVLGHPTARRLGRRPGIAVDLERVIAAAVAAGTALELNGSPERLDLPDEAARLAAAAGALFSVATDAHSPEALAGATYGVNIARRALVDPDRVLNAWAPSRLLRHLRERRTRLHGTGVASARNGTASAPLRTDR